MVEAGEQLVAGCVFEDEPTANTATEREQIGGAQTLDEAAVASKNDAK